MKTCAAATMPYEAKNSVELQRFFEMTSKGPTDVCVAAVQFNDDQVCKDCFDINPLQDSRLFSLLAKKVFNFREGSVRDWLVGFVSYLNERPDFAVDPTVAEEIFATLKVKGKPKPTFLKPTSGGIPAFADNSTVPHSSVAVAGDMAASAARNSPSFEPQSGIFVVLSKWSVGQTPFYLVETMLVTPTGENCLFFPYRERVFSGNAHCDNRYTDINFVDIAGGRGGKSFRLDILTDVPNFGLVLEGRMQRRTYFGECEASKIYLQRITDLHDALEYVRSEAELRAEDDSRTSLRSFSMKISAGSADYAAIEHLDFSASIGAADPELVENYFKTCKGLSRTYWDTVYDPNQPMFPQLREISSMPKPLR